MTAFEDFAEGLLKIFHFNPATAELPIQVIESPLYMFCLFVCLFIYLYISLFVC